VVVPLVEKEDVVKVYSIPLKWKATYKAENVLIKTPITLGLFSTEQRGKHNVFIIEFETDTPDKRVVEQKACLLLEGLRNVLDLYMKKPCIIELDDLKLLNFDDIKGKESIKVITGETLFRQKLTAIEFSEGETKRLKQIYELLYPHKLRFVNATDYQLHYCLLTALHWYSKAIHEGVLSDLLVDLWISFNAMYSFVWRQSHKSLTREMIMVKYFIAQSGLLSSNECKNILENHPQMVYGLMPERGAKEHAINEFGKNWKRYFNNPYGFEFWSYNDKNQWPEALAEVVSLIYGIRNGIFHGGWLPKDSELMGESITVLHQIVGPSLQKLVEGTVAS
jgi:hypothetical protein